MEKIQHKKLTYVDFMIFYGMTTTFGTEEATRGRVNSVPKTADLSRCRKTL